MKKISFVAAILVSAALASACHKNKPADKPSTGSDMGSAAGSGSAAPAGSDAPAGGGSAAM